MKPPKTPEEKRKLTVAVSLLAVMAGAVAVLAATGCLTPIVHELCYAFKDKDSLRVCVEGYGSMAPAVFITLQALQVAFAPIPGELTGAVGGFLFGGAWSIIYSTVGLTLGSLMAFFAARIIGLPLVKLVVSEDILTKFGFLAKRKGAWLALVLFTLPGFPKDFLCYILGLSPMGSLTFLIVCGLGRIPGTIMLSYSGSAVFDENWALVGILTLLCCVVAGIGYCYRQRIEFWLHHEQEDTP